jgi:16S rRNA (guanine1207-N2)-methyltransferase
VKQRRRVGGDRRAAGDQRVTARPASPNATPVTLAVTAAQSQSWRTVTLGGQALACPTDPFCEDDARDPANELLAEYAACHPGDSALLLGVGCGLLAAWVARRIAPGPLILSDSHSAALERTVRTLRQNGIDGYTILPADRLAELAESELAVALVNSAFQSSTRALNDILDAVGRGLRPGGRVYVAGAKSKGIAAIKTHLAERFGAAATLGYRKAVHVVVATRQTAIWADAIAARPAETTTVSIRDFAFQLTLRDGIFARGGLDDGTRLLIQALAPRPDDAALDLGCGGGVLGMTLARLVPQGHVTLIDSDTSAVALARQNLAVNGIRNATVCLGDGIQAVPGATFDLIATNPPFHQGRRQTTAIALQFIADAAQALRPGGRFYLVANRFLPYERAILLAFGNVREVLGDGRFKILSSEKTHEHELV